MAESGLFKHPLRLVLRLLGRPGVGGPRLDRGATHFTLKTEGAVVTFWELHGDNCRACRRPPHRFFETAIPCDICSFHRISFKRARRLSIGGQTCAYELRRTP